MYTSFFQPYLTVHTLALTLSLKRPLQLTKVDGKIDTSELIRVFGELNPAPKPKSTLQVRNEELRKANTEMSIMRAKLDSLKNESALKNEIIEGLSSNSGY